MISHVSKFFNTRPLLRGMVIYGTVWPASSSVQQLLFSKEPFDWKKPLRFCLVGSFFVAPSLYGWLRISRSMWPETSLKTGIYKSIVDTCSYGAFTSIGFFTLTCLMEGKSWRETVREVKVKFPETYKLSVCYWPFVTAVNFGFVPERNRMAFAAVASFIWTIFLAYVKQLDVDKVMELKKLDGESF